MVLITKEEAYNIIFEINEEAHEYTWHLWEEAGDDEELREDASFQQQEAFRDDFYDLDDDIQEDIWHYVANDKDFEADFLAWFGED